MTKKISFTPEQAEMFASLTDLQRKFISELIKPGISQRQAYINAGGLSKGEAAQDVISSKMLRVAKVRAIYDSLMQSKSIESIMERDEALSILSNNARVKMTDVANYEFVCVGQDSDGEDIMHTVWTMKDSKDIDPNLISCIKSVTMTKQGPKIELHDQQSAIKQLTDLQGWSAPKRTEIAGLNGGKIQHSVDVSSPEIASALSGLMDKL